MGRAYYFIARILESSNCSSRDVAELFSKSASSIDRDAYPDMYCDAAYRAAWLYAGAGEWTLAGELFGSTYDTQDRIEYRSAGDGAFAPAAATERYSNSARWAAYCYARAGLFSEAVEFVEAGRCRYLGKSQRDKLTSLVGLGRTNPRLVEEFVAAIAEMSREPHQVTMRELIRLSTV